jgi:hypothetical protein
MSAKRILASLALFARIVLAFEGAISPAHTRVPLAVTAVVKAASLSGDTVSLGETVAIFGLRLAKIVGPRVKLGRDPVHCRRIEVIVSAVAAEKKTGNHANPEACACLNLIHIRFGRLHIG